MQKEFCRCKLWPPVTPLWVNQKQDYPGFSWPNQVSPLTEAQGPSLRSERFTCWSWRSNLPCYERTMDGAISQGPKEGLGSWEWSLTSSKQENGHLSPTTTRNQIFPRNPQAWKKSLSSRKEGSLADTLIVSLWYSEQRTPLSCIRLLTMETEGMKVYIVSKLVNL